MTRKPVAESLPVDVLEKLQRTPAELAMALEWADELIARCGIHMRGWYTEWTKYKADFPSLYDAANDLRDDWLAHVVVARVEYEKHDGPGMRAAMSAFFKSCPKAEA